MHSIAYNSGIRTFAAAPITSFSTNFPATENPLSQSGNWLNGATDGLDWIDLETTTNKAFAAALATPGIFNDGVAQLKRSFLACTSNQFSEGTVFTTYTGAETGTHEIEVFVNMTITAHSVTGYECYVNFAANHTLVRWDGALGAFTPLASNNISTFTAPAEGDVIRLERNGATLNCYQNGVLRTTFNDSTFLGGNPGIGNNPVSGGTGIAINGTGWKFWHCGNF